MNSHTRTDFDARSLRFTAIDIGSNAVRLLFSRVFDHPDQPVFIKESLIRIPIRLGDDAFTDKIISKKKTEKLVKTMQAFKSLIDAYHPIDYLAFATAALREAENGSKIVMEIKQKSGINLKIVDGKSEAELIYSNRSDKILKDFDTFLYIDVGGDSTELTFFSRDGRNKSLSFNLGTVRILENMVWRDDWKQMKIWIKENGMKYRPKIAIGSGGNINKIFRLTTQKLAKPLAYKKMRPIYNNLKSYPYQDRITKLGLRPDRANVIIPASKIYLSVMKWVKVNKILVPQVGLADGAVHVLYQNFKQRKRSQ